MCDAYLLCKTVEVLMGQKMRNAIAQQSEIHCRDRGKREWEKKQKKRRWIRMGRNTFSCRCKWDNIRDPTINGEHLNAYIEYINYIKYACSLCVCVALIADTQEWIQNALKSNFIKIVHIKYTFRQANVKQQQRSYSKMMLFQQSCWIENIHTFLAIVVFRVQCTMYMVRCISWISIELPFILFHFNFNFFFVRERSFIYLT